MKKIIDIQKLKWIEKRVVELQKENPELTAIEARQQAVQEFDNLPK